MPTKPQTTPAMPPKLTETQLLVLADAALAVEPHHNALDRYWLTALAIRESGNKLRGPCNPAALGDKNAAGEYLAVGLMQFHWPAWHDAMASTPTDGIRDDRREPLDSMIAAICYAMQAATPRRVRGMTDDTIRDLVSHHHNSGAKTPLRTSYVHSVAAIRRRLIVQMAK